MSTPALMESSSSPAQANARGALLEVHNLTVKSRDGLTRVDDLSLYLRSGQLIALTGPDALARKAFLRVLEGQVTPDKGQVLVDGIDLNKHWKAFQPRIGWSPEVDGLQAEMTVREALESAARLRLPKGTSRMEREDQVVKSLAAMDLEELAKERISRLTLGARWRTSIAVELVAQPFLLLIEQPDKRLSPEEEATVARLLKIIAQNGTTVFLETTLSAAVHLADQLILFAPGGTLAWFGPPAEALEYFQSYLQPDLTPQGFEGVNGLLAVTQDPPQDWLKRFRDHPAYKQYVGGWLNTQNPDLLLQDQPLARLRQQMGGADPPAIQSRTSFLAQTFFLVGRMLRLLFRTRTGALMLLIPLLAGLTDFLISSPKMNDPSLGDPFWAPAATDYMVLLGLLVMALLFSPIISRERASLQREHWQNLKSFAFIMACAITAGLFSVYAGLVWGAIHFAASGMPGGPTTALIFWVTLALLAWVGAILGLIASAISASPQTAAGLAVLFVVPQLIFSGGILSVSQSIPGTEAVSQVIPARHGFGALLTASGYGQAVLNDPCWQLDRAQRNGLNEQQKQSCTCLGSNIFTQCDFAGVRRSYNPAVNQPEPIEPTPDASLTLPVQPQLQPGETAQDYAKAVDNYTLALESYQGSSDSFVSSMRQYLLADAAWQRDRSLAIGGAESQVELAVARFGNAFRSNLPFNWLALVLSGIFLIFLLGLIQRGKGVQRYV